MSISHNLMHKIRSNIHGIFKPFFDNKPSTLLIQGSAGSGKTTLALELLNTFKEQYKGYYISTRVSLSKLKIQFPWVEPLLSEERVLSNEVNKDIIAADYRAGTVSSLLEHVLNIVISNKHSFIILDSWDALAKEVKFDERIKMEKAIAMFADSNESMVVFISEEPSNTSVSYLADGIVTLENRSLDQGLRKLIIEKMRGTYVPYHQHYFTLMDGHFIILTRKTDYEYINPRLFEPINSIKGYISTGNKDLDDILSGGFKKGSIVLFELYPDTNRRFLAIILASFVLNALRSGNLAFVVSAADRPYTRTLRYIEPFCTDEDLERLSLFVFEKEDTSRKFLVNDLTNDPDYNFRIFTQRYEYIKERYKGKDLVITYDLGWYEMRNRNTLEILRSRLVSSFRKIRKNGDVEIIVNRSGLESMTFAEMVSDLHIKLWEESGIPLLEVKKPYIGTYGVIEDESKGYPAYMLVPIV